MTICFIRIICTVVANININILVQWFHGLSSSWNATVESTKFGYKGLVQNVS